MRYAAKRDSNHAELADAVDSISEASMDTSRLGGGLPDYLGMIGGIIHFFEFKMPGGKLTPAERRFHELFAGATNLHVVETVEDVLKVRENETENGLYP